MTMAEAFGEKAVLGIFYLLGFILWSVEALLSLFCLQNTYKVFRGKASNEEIKNNLARAVIQNAV